MVGFDFDFVGESEDELLGCEWSMGEEAQKAGKVVACTMIPIRNSRREVDIISGERSRSVCPRARA